VTKAHRTADRNDPPQTLLDAFCRRHAITTPNLADAANVSRQHAARVRGGRVPRVTIDMAKQLARGAAHLLRRHVAIGELFDLNYFYRRP
jgi:plasmid maintenance system antidote protein VapI